MKLIYNGTTVRGQIADQVVCLTTARIGLRRLVHNVATEHGLSQEMARQVVAALVQDLRAGPG